MPRIPDHLLDRLKREVDVASLVSRSGIELKRVGENLLGRCSRHEDSTPSLVVTPAKGLWHCMGACQKGGTVIDWVMWQEGLDFRQAVLKLLTEFFPDEARSLAQAQPSRRFRAEALACPLDEGAGDQDLARQVIAYYHETLKQTREAQAYLSKRGLDSSELVDRFQLGFANRTLGMRLSLKLRRRLQEIGFFRKQTGHEHLTGSVTLPILGEHGEVLNCYGRKIRSDLRPGTPDHLYLPGPRRGLLNREAFNASSEIILCEAPIDALTFWRWGFRNVTTAWGVEGVTEELLEAFRSHGVERCLIAFDRDGAGDAGAEKVGKKLAASGVTCFRVLFPKGMDANDVALKMQPQEKTLALFLRSAEWICGGNGRKTLPLQAGVVVAEAANASPLVAPAIPPPDATTSPAARPEKAAEKKNGPAAEEENTSAPAPEASAGPHEAESGDSTSPTFRFAQGQAHATSTPGHTDGPLVELKGEDEAVFLFGDRRYRIRGLARNTAFGVLKLNVLATREGLPLEGTPISGLHADTFDLYLSRARALFEKQASAELGVKDELVKRDLASMLRKLEELQEKAVQKALEPKVKEILLTQTETAEAMGLLKAPGLLDRIVEDLTRCGLVGEETNKLVSYIAAVSRLLDRPLAVIIQSSSAAGKTSLMEAVLSMVPEESKEKYTAVSGKSLFYFDEDVSLSHKVLAIVEEEGAERATYPLKILQSEGELVMASTGKDPSTGKLVTKIYRVKGPVMILLATTAYELDPELENRCLRLTVDESREQTRRIHELQRMRQSIEGLMAGRETDRIRALHRNAQRLLRPLHVLNPFQKELTFIDDQTRTRRDHEKYLTLIESIALLHQYQRPIRHVKVGEEAVECVEVTLEDIETANRLAAEVLGRTLDELPPQTRRLLMLLDEWVTKETGRLKKGRADYLFSRRALRAATGWGDTQLKIHLARLVDLEYVLVHRGGRGQSFVYELLYAGEGKEGERFVLGLVDLEKLRGYDPARSGQNEERSGAGRAPVGPWSGGGRGEKTSTSPNADAALLTLAAETSENALLPPERKTRSYVLRPFRRGVRFNLLRFPPGVLAACATRRTAAR